LPHSSIFFPLKNLNKSLQVTLQGVSRVSVLRRGQFCSVLRGRRSLWTRDLPFPLPRSRMWTVDLLFSTPCLESAWITLVCSSYPGKMWPEVE
jgi:hypothetical protein